MRTVLYDADIWDTMDFEYAIKEIGGIVEIGSKFASELMTLKD